MAAALLDGKALAAQLEERIRAEVAEFQAETGIIPCLAAILVGADPASELYVRNKERACRRVGIASQLHRMPAAAEAELLDRIEGLNADPAVHGILVQLPLPPPHREAVVLDAVAPRKDVDCFHPENVGRLVQGRPRFLPCTPHGVVQLLHHAGVTTKGRHVVVVGRSEIVGKPLAAMLVQRSSSLGESMANATVTLCHSATRDLAAVTRTAEILVVAIGRPRFVDAAMVQPGTVVVDVGINRTPAGLVGDVAFDAVRPIASRISPVPGGVGPLTVTMLLQNTLAAARMQSGVDH